MSFYYPKTKFDLIGKTLIVPIVSTGNVSQLVVDLLIASLALRRVGIFDPRDLIPIVGGREDGEEGVTTPLELYGKDGLNIVVIQQRSPALKSRKQEFVASLLEFTKTSSFAAVLLLSAVNPSNRSDSQMLTPSYHIIPPNSPSLSSTPLSMLSQFPIPRYTSPTRQHPYRPDGDVQEQESTIPFIPGGGLTRRILSAVSPDWPIATACLLQFVMEGDNRGDAYLLASVVAKILGIDSTIGEWKQPSSWQRGLFGAAHDQTLYG